MAKPFNLDEPKFSPSPLGEQRVLVICLPESATIESSLTDPFYTSIDWDGFKERDLEILEFRKQTSHLVKEHRRAEAVPRALVTHAWYHTTESHKKIGTTTKCDNKLEYVLIGKDKTVKKRWGLFPSNDDLYSTIDAMPMRQIEIRNKRNSN